MKDYNRVYATEVEYSLRLQNFWENSLIVDALNRAHAHRKNGAWFKLNKFADWSEQEQRSLRGFKGVNVTSSMLTGHRAKVKATAAPTSVDWRQQGVLAPVQDQGQCGSCWAFSTVANIESQWAIKNKLNPPLKLSEQKLVDCDHECGTYRSEQGCDQGCNGGLMPNGFKYAMANGMPTETSYPYSGVDGSCQSPSPTNVKVASWTLISQDEGEMAAWVAANGPASIAVYAQNWSFYMGGIMEYLCWGKITVNDLDHGVVIAGYGSDSGTDYWLIRNSWGADWGEAGYCRILRNQGFCGVNLFACSSQV